MQKSTKFKSKQICSEYALHFVFSILQIQPGLDFNVTARQISGHDTTDAKRIQNKCRNSLGFREQELSFHLSSSSLTVHINS